MKLACLSFAGQQSFEAELTPEDKYVKHVTEVLTEGRAKMTCPQADQSGFKISASLISMSVD